MTHVIIYSRPGCHLCEEMKSLVERVGLSIPIAVQEIDISGDEQLESLYGLEVPVLMVEGEKAAKYRVTEGDLRRIVAGRTGGPGELTHMRSRQSGWSRTPQCPGWQRREN